MSDDDRRGERDNRDPGHAGWHRPIDTSPATVHEVITRRMVEELGIKLGDVKTELSLELTEVRNRVNGLIFVVIGAVVVQVVGKAGGWL